MVLVKWMFVDMTILIRCLLCNKGIQLTYGMSIDYLGYKGIMNRHTQRGGTLITRHTDGSVSIKMVPLKETL